MNRNRYDLAALPLRLILGYGFMYHGFPKLFIPSEHQSFVGMLQGIGVPAPALMAWVVGLVEFFGGIALVLGAFTAVAAALLSVDMLVAMLTVHLPSGFSFINITGMTAQGPVFGMPGMEVTLVYLAGLLSLLVGGAGAYALDPALEARLQALRLRTRLAAP